MKKWKSWIRASAVALTCALMCASPMAHAEEPATRPEDSFGAEGILFRQSDFYQTADPAVGRLSMELRIKPVDGQPVQSGYFTFRYDSNYLSPVLATGEQMLSEKVASNGVVAAGLKGGQHIWYYKWQGEGEGNLWMRDEPIHSAIKWNIANPTYNMDINSDISIFAISQTRTGMETSYTDAYLYFNFFEAIPVDGDGWATIATLEFNCKNFGKPVPDTSILNKKSFVVPTTAAEAADILAQFNVAYYEEGTIEIDPDTGKVTEIPGTKHEENIATGAAAYSTAGGKHHYFTQPAGFTDTMWGDHYWTDSVAISGAPGLYYDGMENTYTVERVYADIANTSGGDDTDFPIPAGQGGEGARYTVPTKATEDANGGDWIPDNYVGPGKTPKRVPLKYSVGTVVTDSSIARPESSEAEYGMGLDNFLRELKWEFTTEDGTPLSELTWADETEPVDVNGKKISQATLVTSGTAHDKLNGCKVQIVREGDKLSVTPVGVTLECPSWSGWEGTKLSYYPSLDSEEPVEATTMLLPQVHITCQAADPENFIWQPSEGGVTGMIYFRASFTSAGNEFHALLNEAQLVREEAVATRVVVDLSDLPAAPESASGAAAAGITVGRTVTTDGTVSGTDPVAEGVGVKAYVYDQYDLPLTDKAVDFTITPSADTQAGMTAAGKSNVFQTSAGTTITTGTVGYGTSEDGRAYGPYDVYGGYYVISATCDGVDSSTQPIAERTIHVTRPENFLYSINLLSSTGIPFGYDTVPTNAYVFHVPERKNGRVQTVSTKPYFMGLNSQYVAKGMVGAGTKQIIEDFVYNPDTTLNIQDLLSREGLDITFEWALESGDMPLDGSIGLNQDRTSPDYGTLSITSIATNCVILYKIHVTYNGITKTATSKLRLQRDPSRLETIRLLEVNNGTPIAVPTPTEEALNGYTEVEVRSEAFDQYDEYLDWSVVNTLYAPGGSKNPNPSSPAFLLQLKADGEIPSGIVQLTDGGFKFRITNTAQTGSFQVIATYAQPGLLGVTSEPTTISVRRADPVLATITKPVYPNNGEVVSPSKTASPVTTTPTYTFYDQYGVLMTDTTGITLSWRVDKSATTATGEDGEKPEFRLDPDTGAVTILPCARDGKVIQVRVTARHVKDGKLVGAVSSVAYEVRIRRLPAMVEFSEVATEVIDYPTYEESSLVQLQARGTSQYGEAELITSESGIGQRWELVSVTTDKGEIRATGNMAGNVTLTASGRVNFARLQDGASLARSIKVRVYLASVESEVKEIQVRFQPSVPTRVYILAQTTRTINVPEAVDGTTSRELTARVQDQYGVNLDGYTISWSVGEFTNTGVAGSVRFAERNGHYYIDVDPSAGECEVPVTATNTELNLSKTENIRITKGNLVITSVSILPVNAADELILPSQAEKTATYQLSAHVIDNYNFPMLDEAVTWTATGSGVTVDATTGILTVPYSEAVRTSGRGSVQLTATSVTNPSISATKTVTIVKAAPVPTYAAWDLLRMTYDDQAAPTGVATKEYRPEDIDSTHLIWANVPGRSNNNTVLELHGKVYSQYEEEMPGEKPTWSIKSGSLKGIELTEDPSTGVGTLDVTYLAVGQFVELQSAPAAASDKLANMTSGRTSNFMIFYQKGVPGATMTELDPNNNYTLELPEWDPVGDYLADLDSVYTEYYSLSATVLDQYERPMPDYATYPVWEMMDEVPGVSLVPLQQDPKVLNRVTGDNIEISVDHNTLREGELSRTFRVKVYADSESQAGDLLQIITVTLVKDVAEPSYIYWVNVDEDGLSSDPAEVPTKLEDSATYDLVATVYDQYGYVMEYDQLTTKPSWDFDEIESAYPGCTLTPVDGGKSTEFSYNGYRMAKVEHSTGKLTVYYAATVPTLPLVASIGEAKPRDGVLPLHWAVLEPAVMELTQDPFYDESGYLQEYGRIELGITEGPTEAGFTSVIYDQFGYVVEADQEIPDVHLFWEIYWREDEDDPWIPYVEYDERTGLAKPADEYTIRMLEDTSRRGVLWIDHENTLENHYWLLLQAKAMYQDGTVTEVGDAVPIELFSNLFSGGELDVYFDAGLHGTLEGPTYMQVFRGRTVDDVPEVNPDEGYTFLGWTSDGRNLCNPATRQIVRSVTFTAVYEERFAGVQGGGIVADIGGAAPQAAFIDGRDGVELAPAEGVSKAEFIKMVVVGLVGYDEMFDYGDNFADVPKDAWYANYFACAKASGLLSGVYADPTAIVTREEAAEILCKAMGLAPIESPTEEQCFLDVDIAYYLAGEIAALKQAGVVKGGTDGMFYPSGKLSRAEAIAMVVRAQNLCSEETLFALAEDCDAAPFQDIAVGNWAYPYVLSATGYLTVQA